MAEEFENIGDSDHMLHFVVSDLGHSALFASYPFMGVSKLKLLYL